MLWCVCKRCYCVSWFHAPWYWGCWRCGSLRLWNVSAPALRGPFRYLKMFR